MQLVTVYVLLIMNYWNTYFKFIVQVNLNLSYTVVPVLLGEWTAVLGEENNITASGQWQTPSHKFLFGRHCELGTIFSFQDDRALNTSVDVNVTTIGSRTWWSLIYIKDNRKICVISTLMFYTLSFRLLCIKTDDTKNLHSFVSTQ